MIPLIKYLSCETISQNDQHELRCSFEDRRMVGNVPKEELHPILPDEAEGVYRDSAMKFIRAAYLRGFMPHEEQKCRHKFPHFKTWWKTLNERQRERVKGTPWL